MSEKQPKTIDSLMRYLREEKQIAIEGSDQKRRLMNMGYYHGYKGYRYIGRAANLIPYTNFNQLVSVYEFDTQLKALFYPFVMQIETALKNYVLETIVELIHSDSFPDIYSQLLDNYKTFSHSSTKKRTQAQDRYKQELKRRLELRNRIYKVQTDAFSSGNKIAEHYLNKDINLPIWAIFELLSLGEFGHFVSCLNPTCRKAISEKLEIRRADDTNAMMPQRLIYATKDLRNAIAHNDVIFDTRFRTGNIDNQVKNAIFNETGVSHVTFESITDYLVLITYQLSLLHFSKTDRKQLIASFSDCAERLRSAIPLSVYNQIILTDHVTKIQVLEKFIDR